MNFITTITNFMPVLLLLVIAPFCMVRFLFPEIKLAMTIALTCMMMVILNTIIPIIMHITQTPITSSTLTSTHILLTIFSYISIRLRKITIIPTHDTTEKQLLLLLAGFSIIILPFTALAGIDTYKWLDFAMSMKVEQSIPWLVHPLSLFGFTTGRSYPSAQPLVLGSIMTISNLNVEWSFYFMSLISGFLGITSAFILSQKCFSYQPIHLLAHSSAHRSDSTPPTCNIRSQSKPNTHVHTHVHTGGVAPATPCAMWTAFFYGFSPIFMRYNHWATGRGLFIAIFPLFLLTLINLSKTEIKKQKKKRITFIIINIIGFIILGLFLPLSHKAGLIALLMLTASLLPALLLPRNKHNWLIPVLTIIAIIAAITLSPNKILPFPLGLPIGFLYTSLTRFGWLLPLAAIGLLTTDNWFKNPHLHRLFPALLISLPFSCSREMYGALIALIFVALAATNGFIRLTEKYPTKRKLFTKITIIMIITGALAIIIHRSITATPRRVRDAAIFLEQYDPNGPFQITSNNWRTKIQGYVSGCPRFKINKTGPVKISIHNPPSIKGSPAQVLANWTSYSRHIISVSGLSVLYYGKNPRRYIFYIDKTMPPPAGTINIYNNNGIQIFKPAKQHIPSRNTTASKSIKITTEMESKK